MNLAQSMNLKEIKAAGLQSLVETNTAGLQKLSAGGPGSGRHAGGDYSKTPLERAHAAFTERAHTGFTKAVEPKGWEHHITYQIPSGNTISVYGHPTDGSITHTTGSSTSLRAPTGQWAHTDSEGNHVASGRSSSIGRYLSDN
jgi:hypothetical protein